MIGKRLGEEFESSCNGSWVAKKGGQAFVCACPKGLTRRACFGILESPLLSLRVLFFLTRQVQKLTRFFSDLQARATSEIAVASLRDLDNLYTVNCTQNFFFFHLNMLWSRHVKPSPAIGEKSERSEIRDIKVCTDWSFPEAVKCTIYDPLYKDGWIKRMQPKNMLRKNLPKALTAVLSPSRSANRALPGSSQEVAVGTAVAVEGGVANVTRMCGQPTPPLFFFWTIGVGTRPGREWVCSLTLTLKLQDISKGPRTHTFPFPIILFFFFLGCASPAPLQGGEGTSRGAQSMSRLSKAQFNQRLGWH